MQKDTFQDLFLPSLAIEIVAGKLINNSSVSIKYKLNCFIERKGNYFRKTIFGKPATTAILHFDSFLLGNGSKSVFKSHSSI